MNENNIENNHSKQITSPVINVNVAYKEHLTPLNKLALWITIRVGSMGFFIIIFTWSALWLLWNTIGPKALRFDPYPAFVFWLFISNLIQILLMPLIMVGQNLQGIHAEIRAETDFRINQKAEAEIESILLHLEKQNELILEILKKLDSK
ncbi:MAG: DUF1003 domain-containing protein [Sphingobacteriales bacterium]|uniref:DUF1003 domain-containing protein n=1 Tax=Hydrotalea flava TaxID=714549 RepID=UPI0008370EAF|nr:DUF1003 domain-containing protein [Hydrotalea flava]RTL55139.1 MAG: DUF1003 domain-containing protein [Sphingobacteriales bacterium]